MLQKNPTYFYISYTDLYYKLFTFFFILEIMNDVRTIFVNQIGYEVDGNKFAYVRGSQSGNSFFIVDECGKTVFSGKVNEPVKDRVAAEDICAIDFSEFKEEGTFAIKVGDGESVSFKIGCGLFDDLFLSILRYFTLSRCGQEIKMEDEKLLLWNHPACHTGTAKIFGTDETKKVLGGWHDAGDYGRYIVAGTKAVMDLLLAYEAVGKSFKEFDILDEVRFELEWMLQMQREDGAVYHKISCYHFCSFILPQNELDDLVISPISTAATADFAGCLAYASTFYKTIDEKFSKTLLVAAEKAQNYLENHEDELYKNPPEISTGYYGDWNLKDERYFAYAALYSVTKNQKYLEEAIRVRKEAEKIPFNETEPWKVPWCEGFGWSSVAGYGTEILLKNKKDIQNKEIIDYLENSVKTAAEKIFKCVENASFGTCLERFVWGSNGAICDNAHVLLMAYDLTRDERYFEAARKQADYLLGCNPLDVCYVTGFGANSVKNPHHRPSGALKNVMHGMLAGGPSEWLADEVAKANLQNKPPLQCYIDKQGSYCTNEIAIYWNSAFVYLVSRVCLK